MKACLNKKNVYKQTIIGIFLIVVGTIFFWNTTRIHDYIISCELVINPNKPYAYNLWKNTPFPITLDIYFFNWTNPEDFLNKSTKPILKEVGPYRFFENKTKVDVVYHEDNGTISFKQMREWYFDEEYSVGSIDDEITSINPIAATASTLAKRFNFFFQKTASVTMLSFIRELSETKKVGEILFYGYNDPLFNLAKKFPSIHGIEVPPFENFGWFSERNGSTKFEGTFNMGTGEKNYTFGQLYKWNYDENSKYFKGACEKIHSSAGEFFHPFLKKDEEVKFFFPDMCRPLDLEFEKEHTINGLKAFKYIGTDKTFDNGTKYPNKKCYCDGKCIPSGLGNVTRCRYGAPGYVSFPHFYLADPEYSENFIGLNPSRELHEFHINAEPRTGLPIDVDGKLQINLLIEPNENIALFRDVPTLYFPVLWFSEKVLLPNDIAFWLKVLLAFPIICRTVSGLLIILGIILLIPCFLNIKDKYLWSKQKRMQDFQDELSTTPAAKIPLMDLNQT